MAAHINLPRIIAAADAPDYIQHLTTDVNDVINRINAVLITVLANLEALEARISALEP